MFWLDLCVSGVFVLLTVVITSKIVDRRYK
jgi:hypothetical protein